MLILPPNIKKSNDFVQSGRRILTARKWQKTTVMKRFSPSQTSISALTRSRLFFLLAMVMSLLAIPSSTFGSLISGTAFQDDDGDGAKAGSEAGVLGVTVTAYDSSGGFWTDTTAADGTYTVDAVDPGPYRVEFTGAPSGLLAGTAAGTSGAAVQFLPDGNSTGIDVAYLNLPTFSPTATPDVVTTCFADGPSGGVNGVDIALIGFPYAATGHLFDDNAKAATNPSYRMAAIQDIGAAYGLAFQKTTERVYVGAYQKRYSGYGPNGPDAIYQFDVDGNSTGVIDLDNLLPGTNVAGSDPHDFTAAGDGIVFDLGTANSSYDGVGKLSLGDIEMSGDSNTLYVVNLFDRKIYAIDVTDGVAANATALNTPDSTTTFGWDAPDATGAGRHRPFGLAWDNGKLWVGSVDDNGTSAYVHSLDPSGTTFDLELTVPLTYARQAYIGGDPDAADRSTEWRAWSSDPETITYQINGSNETSFPQAMLTDIEFDGTDMVLGFRDRFGDQTGADQRFRVSDGDIDPDSGLPDPGNTWGTSAGDILRACWDAANSEFDLETGAAGDCPGVSGITDSGPGGIEYYHWDVWQDADTWNTQAADGAFHWEIGQGALLQLPGQNAIMMTCMDPVDDFSGGVLRLDNATGRREGLTTGDTFTDAEVRANGGFTIYETGDFNGAPPSGSTFAKSNGLGDIEAMEVVPTEVGDYVWADLNLNGVQDPDENGIAGVVVSAYQDPDCVPNSGDEVLIGTASTDSEGAYLFGGPAGTNLDAGKRFIPGSCHLVVIDQNQIVLANSITSPANADNDNRDSDGEALAANGGSLTGQIASVVVVNQAGDSSHDFDFGFAPLVVGDFVWNDTNGDGVQDPGEPGISGVAVTLHDVNGDPVLCGGSFSSDVAAYADDFDPNADFTGSDVAGSSWDITPWVIDSGDANVQTLLGSSAGVLRGVDAATQTVVLSRAGIDLSGCDPGTARISFDFFLNGTEAADEVYLEYDDGTGFQTGSPLWTGPVGTNANPFAFTGVDVPIPEDATAIRFRLVADKSASDPSSDFLVFDNVQINCDVTTPLFSGTITDANGFYSFDVIDCLSATTSYQIQIDTAQAPLSGLFLSPQNTGGSDALDSDAADEAGTAVIAFASPASGADPTRDFGFTNTAAPACTIGATVTNLTRDDAGTPFVTTDDTFSFTVTVNDVNGSSFGWTSDGTPAAGPYGVGVNYGPFPVSGGTVTINYADFADPACAAQAAPAPPSVPEVSIGNLVFLDVDGDGIYEPGASDTGAANVTVELYQVGGDGVIGGGDDVLVATQATSAIVGTEGCYQFNNLAPSSYYVLIPAAEFNGGDLDGLISSNGADGDTGLDDDAGENGIDVADPGATGVSSGVIALAVDSEPTDAGSGAGSETESGKGAIDDNSDDNNGDLTVDFGFVDPADLGSIAGTTFEDTTGDGNGNVVINLTTIRLCSADGTTAIDNPNITGTQDYVIPTSDGTYAFTNLPPGSYTVKQDQPAGVITVSDGDSTTPGDDTPPNNNTQDNSIPVTIVAGETDDGNDFVEVVPMSVGNFVFCDDNDNGLFDGSETGINGVALELFYDANNDGDFDDGTENTVAFASDTTINDGAYLFDGLRPGNYIVRVSDSNFAPSGALETKSMSSTTTDTNDNGEDNDDNGFQSAPGDVTSSPIITLALDDEPGSGGTLNVDDTIDFGFTEPVGIGNHVWIDTDGDGAFDPGTDTVVEFITVELYTADQTPGTDIPVATTETDAGGCYNFGNLLPGDYIVHIPAAEFDTADDGDGQGTSGELANSTSLPGHSGDDQVDDDLPNNDAGIDSPNPRVTGISSVVINLAIGAEPAETGKDDAGDFPDDNIDWTIDFGFTETPGTVAIGNLVFNDTNGDGDFDSGSESGIDGVIVELFTAASPPGVGNPIARTESHNGGCYLFSGLAPGSYIVHVRSDEFGGGEPLENLVSSAGADTDSGTDDDANENGIDNPNPTNGGVSSLPITLSSGDETATNESGKDSLSDDAFGETDTDLTVDFGFTAPNVGIGNLVFNDANGDGDFDSGSESGIDGVSVELYTAGQTPGTDTPVATTVTTGGGCYSFTGLADASYIVHIPATNFASSLSGLVSSAGASGDDETDDDNNENGIDTPNPSASGTSSAPIALAAGTEPSETGKDNTADAGVDDNHDLSIDFGFTPPTGAGIGNKVFADTDRNGILGSGENGVDGAVVELFASGDDPLTATPIQSTITAGGGCYYFGNLPDGDYFVHLPASNFAAGAPLDGTVSSPGNGGDDGNDDDSNENGIDNPNPPSNGVSSGVVALASGTEGSESGAGGGDDDGAENDNDLSVDMGFAPAGVGIGNLVFRDGNGDGNFDPATETGIDGVTVELYLGATLVATTETRDGGCYLFSGLADGSYTVVIPASEFLGAGSLANTQSSTGAGSDTTADDDADENGDDDESDGVSSNVFALAANTEPTESGKDGTSDDANENDYNLTADFGFTSKAGTFAQWQVDNSGLSDTTPGGDPDMDGRSNLEEFALCLKAGSGLNGTAVTGGDSNYAGFCIEPNAAVIDGTFLRPVGVTGLTYSLQFTDILSTPTTWTTIPVTATGVDQGDGTELVTLADIETLTSLMDAGFVRLQVALDSPAETIATKPQGYLTHTVNAECETFAYPFEDKQLYGGKASAVAGNTLTLDPTTLVAGDDVGAALAGAQYYVEITGGTNEGHRFEIDEANSTADTLALLTDGLLCEGTDESTLTSVPDISGEMFVIRRYRTIAELFPPADYTAGGDVDTGANILCFDPATQTFTTYFLLEDGATDKWVVSGSTADRGGDIVPPGKGLFTHNKAPATSFDLLEIGTVRCNSSIQPLKAGFNFIAATHPVATSPEDRAMVATTFNGTTDPVTADQLLFWKGDADLGATGYDARFYLVHDDGTNPALIQWTDTDDVGLENTNTFDEFGADRSAIYETESANPTYSVPTPFTAN